MMGEGGWVIADSSLKSNHPPHHHLSPQEEEESSLSYSIQAFYAYM
jgi:hypothetical protein